MDNEKREKKAGKTYFNSLNMLIEKWRDGSFGEIIDDWKWILSYSAKYKKEILIYVILGLVSTSLGLVTSVANKYMIDIITGYQMNKLWLLVVITVVSAGCTLAFKSINNRISAKLKIYINNDVQADIFDKIMDADWMEISRYSNGDVLNRFNEDVITVSSNAISWLPTIIISLYNFIATFLVILHYDIIMAFITFATAPFMILFSRFLIKKQREYSKKAREVSSELMTFETETFYNMDTIKSFGTAPHYGRKMRWWQRRYKDIYLKCNMFSIKTSIMMQVLGQLVQYLACCYCL